MMNMRLMFSKKSKEGPKTTQSGKARRWRLIGGDAVSSRPVTQPGPSGTKASRVNGGLDNLRNTFSFCRGLVGLRVVESRDGLLSGSARTKSRVDAVIRAKGCEGDEEHCAADEEFLRGCRSWAAHGRCYSRGPVVVPAWRGLDLCASVSA